MRYRHGTQAACKCCSQDIEYHGPAHGWLDRGGNRACVSSIVAGEIVAPPKGAKHRPYEWK